MKRFFTEADSPNLNDHDFPVPGYLLNVSGHMKLTFGELLKNYESSYVIHALPVPNFHNMLFDGEDTDIFTVLSRQAEIQWKMKMSAGIIYH